MQTQASEKQKEGVKRLRQFNKVEIPQAAFVEALKMVIEACSLRRTVAFDRLRMVKG
ncbi:MAG: hypothetical protein M9905_20715 [Rhizobiaceae bacterium]|nr:hypothetical protein [Rhizobiaceae bacterium]